MVSLVRRSTGLGVLAVALVLVLSGCSFFGQDKTKSTSVSVFDVKIGDCFLAPAPPPKVDLTHLSRVKCSTPHQQESYALLPYKDPATGQTPKDFPGAAALKSFADGNCAQEFEGYVDSDYRDSSLFFTYLAPSPRSWAQDDDVTVICFITTTGQTLTTSVKGSGA